MIECSSSKLMGTHFLQTLEALGRLARAIQDAAPNGITAKHISQQEQHAF